MNEIAKCPRCGETPKRIQYKAGGFGHICCGAEFFCTTYWNKYAAAMELAKLTVQMKTCRAYCPESAFLYAQDRVVEVFGIKPEKQVAEAISKHNNVMVYLNGKDKPAFKCSCGCNVFHHPTGTPEEKSHQTYICNACDTQYVGE